jgi:hypothetical protein
VLEYDKSFNVISWGYSVKKKKNKDQTCENKIAERFKLKLRSGEKEDKIYLPEGLGYKKAITDYLTKIREVMQKTLEKTCKVDFYKQVLIIMTVNFFVTSYLKHDFSCKCLCKYLYYGYYRFQLSSIIVV